MEYIQRFEMRTCRCSAVFLVVPNTRLTPIYEKIGITFNDWCPTCTSIKERAFFANTFPCADVADLKNRFFLEYK